MVSVPTAYFDYRDFNPADRLAAFRQMTSAVYDVQAEGFEDEFRATAHGYRVGSLVFNEAIVTPAWFDRTKQHTKGLGNDFLVLQAQIRGSEQIEMGSRTVYLLPGNIYLRDWAYPFRSNTTSMHLHSVLIPRHRLKRTVFLSESNPILSWPVEDPEGAMLFRLWSELLDRLPYVSLRQAVTLAEGFLGFVDGLLAEDAGSGETGKLQSMEQFLQMHLRENITVADLCRRFHVSRATVYRSFVPHGGVRGFIDRARLDRVRMELRHADPARTRVADVAASWGFFGASSFSRRFRKQFGQSPSEVLREPLEGFPDTLPTRHEGSESFRSYMKWLNVKGRQVA